VGKLLGYRLDKAVLSPGENLEITLYWRVGQTTDHNYSVFVHLFSDRVVAQHDGWPAEGQKPTSAWALQEVITDRHVVPIGPDVPPGTYWLVVGMYDAATLTSVSAFQPNGRPFEGGRIILQAVTVVAP